MAFINTGSREIHCKIVYYGPGYCGKTTNLQYIHACAPQDVRGDLLAIATEGERTLFFDFLPLDLGQVHGFQVRFHLYTVPGQVLYERTRVAVLSGVDGVVFVADSAPEKLEENYQSMVELETNMQRMGKDLGSFPFVLQWNKRDCARCASPSCASFERMTWRRGRRASCGRPNTRRRTAHSAD
jgi:signal recognition particle receptor subunit beta